MWLLGPFSLYLFSQLFHEGSPTPFGKHQALHFMLHVHADPHRKHQFGNKSNAHPLCEKNYSHDGAGEPQKFGELIWNEGWDAIPFCCSFVASALSNHSAKQVVLQG